VVATDASPRAEGGATVPQRLTLVLPSTGEFDSRSFRIATSAVARGHTVTIVARWRPGLPREERHPAGYLILRVPFAAVEGLPAPGLVRLARSAVRRLGAWRTGTPYEPPPEPLRRAGEAEATPVTGATGAGRSLPAIPSPAADAAPSLFRRLATGAIRRLSIPLTIRAQGRFAVRIAPSADLVHGMAYMGIPVALRLGRRDAVPVVYDARDIYLEAANLARMRGPMRVIIRRAERDWARRAARVITVNRPYAEVMAQRFRVPEPLVVLNCSYRFDPPEPRPRRFHEALGLDPSVVLILYQGGFSPERGIEQLIAAIGEVPGAVLVLMGYGRLETELRTAEAASGGLVRVMPAVAPEDLLMWVASADIVAMPIQPSTLNHRLTTPNKLFEAMAAGVPVVASDLPGMAPYVREVGCGVLVDPTDPHAIARALRQLVDGPPEVRRTMGARGLAAAHERYHWERQAELLFAEYSRLTGRRW